MSVASSPADLVFLTGPMLLGHLFNWGLFGVLTVQTYTYYCAFPSDSWQRKSVVTIAYALELAQVIMSTHDAFRVFALGWGDPRQLEDVGLYWLDIVILTALISLVCELFYASSIFALSRSYLVAGLVCVATLAQTSLAMLHSVNVQRAGTLSKLNSPLVHKTSVLWASVCLLSNAIITVSMSIWLWKMKRQSGVPQTASLLTQLLKLVVDTGLANTMVTSAALLLSLLNPDTMLFAVPLFVVSKIYTNSLLAILNSRVQVVGGCNAAVRSIMNDRTNISFKTASLSAESLKYGEPMDKPGRRSITVEMSDTLNRSKSDLELKWTSDSAECTASASSV